MKQVTGKTKSYLAGGIRTNMRDVEERNGLEIRDRNCDNILDSSTETKPYLFVLGQTLGFASTGACVPAQRTGPGYLTALRNIQNNSNISTSLPHQAIFKCPHFFCQIHHTLTQTQLWCQNPGDCAEVGRSDGRKDV